MKRKQLKENETVQAITKRDERKIISYFQNSSNKWSTRNLTLFELGINTGLRISDLVALKYSYVFDKNKLRKRIKPIQEQKTGKLNDHLYLVNNQLRKQLSAYQHWLKDNHVYYQYLFPNSRNERTHIKPITFYRTFKRVTRRIGCKRNYGTHSMRKTFGMNQYRKSGYNLVYVQKLLNHSKPTITEHYLGIDKQGLKNEFLKLNS